MWWRSLLVFCVTACTSTHAVAPAGPPAPRRADPLAVLDDLKPYRSYGALVVRDNADGTHTVTINTFTPTDYAHGTRGMGWISQDVRTFDARLEHLVPTHSFMDFWSGWGVL